MPTHSPNLAYRELTLRGMLLAAVMTVFFTASNVYLGLKIGLTFSSSIPAAVISMAVLSLCSGTNILENNMVQTQASVAGAQSSIIFALPALVIIGYWQHFSFLETGLIALAGGILGVIFSIPLRRALVVNSQLPYPEGVAAAKILQVGSNIQAQRQAIDKPSTGALEIFAGSLLAALVNLFTNGFQLLSGSYVHWIATPVGSIFQIPVGFSLAIVGAGYLVGLSTGIAIFFGLFLAWGIIVPYLTAATPIPPHFASDLPAFASMLWQTKVRLMGAGIMTVGAIWTTSILLKPLKEGLKTSLDFNKHSTYRADQDLSPFIMLSGLGITMLMLIGVFYGFVAPVTMPPLQMGLLVSFAIIFTLIVGFLVTSVCGYMAGLVGSSSSPISSIAIIAIISVSLLLLGIGRYTGLVATPSGVHFMIAFAIFITSVILTIACIANDNLQDLNTGYLVGATPWRQQVALLIGCFIGALVIAPIIELVYQAYGFIGAMPRAGMDSTQALAAPQATLITTLATGIFHGTTNWNMLYIGMGMGVALIIMDQWLHKKKAFFRLPVLAVGIGLYLPPTIDTPLVIGALLGGLIHYLLQHKPHLSRSSKKAQQKTVDQRATLFASGLIVGESLMGVVMAVTIVISITHGGSDTPLSLLPYVDPTLYANLAPWLGFIVFIISCAWFVYRAVVIKNRDNA